MPLPIEEYHVGWICALSTELAAAKVMLDEEHEMIQGQDPQDSNSYALGRVHNHNVVIACLPEGVDGTNAAATVATNMSRTFKALRFGLMVGIGGGIPHLDRKVDIRLGDIVVSQPTGTNGGVIQYDKGKNLDRDQFERKGTLNMPPSVLLTALASLKADHEYQESRVQNYLDDMLQRYPKMKKSGYAFPGIDKDCLYCTDCGSKRKRSCQKCGEGKMRRNARGDTSPKAHYGVIASGNRVIKSAAERDRLGRDLQALCVEMEAAGLMNDFPCLVIRGICDYADSHKNDDWHKYAALTAAACARELLCVLKPKKVAVMPSWAGKMENRT